jgi:hypothetical protein
METEWYIQTATGQTEGPFNAAMLKARAKSGAIQLDTLVRKGATGTWFFASQIKGLIEDESIDIPAPPPPEATPNKAWMASAVPHPNDKARSHRMEPLASGRTPQPIANSQLKPCPDCGKDVSKAAATCPTCGRPLLTPPTHNKYPALSFIAGLNKFFAVVVPVVCVIGLIAVGGSDIPGKEQAIISLVVYMVLAPLFLWGTAELIRLLIDIEKNTCRLGAGNTAKVTEPREKISQAFYEK